MDLWRTCQRWRTGKVGAGLLVMFVCAYMFVVRGTTGNDSSGDQKPPSNPAPSIAPSRPIIVRPPPAKLLPLPLPEYQLSPKEEAMFGQYQAVGLGSESVDEAYKPVPHRYVSPPNGNIYSTFGVVMASYRPHAGNLSRFFDSMAEFCSDCGRIRFVVIIPSTEVDLFDRIRGDHIKNLPLLEFVPYTQVFPALNDTLAANTPGWPKGWTGWNETRLLESTNKAMFQSFKKMYGCLYLAREFCMFLDSEGFFIRPAILADIYGGFRKSPYVIYSSHVKPGNFATKVARKLLGYQSNWGWALEEYNWPMDTNIIAHLERHFREKSSQLEDMEPLVFIEIVYWVYILHNHHKYPRLRVLDTANLLGVNALDQMRKHSDFAWEHAIGPWEELRTYMEKDPELVDTAVKTFNKYKFKLFKAGRSNATIALLERAPSIVLCVSEQPDNVFEMAIQGHFAKFLGPQDETEQDGSE